MKSRLVTILIAVLLLAPTLGATEVRVVRFLVQPDFNPPPCTSTVGWYSETFFHNSTDAFQTVRFLGVSNGPTGPNPRPLTVPPHQTMEITGRYSPGWEPVPGTILWVNRLDVPSGVIVANRVASSIFHPSSDTTGVPCHGRLANYAGLPLPVFTALIPAGKTQYFLGTDVGSDPALERITDARLNIGVYNGGSVGASAVVKVYCGDPDLDHSLSDTLIETSQIQIPADSIVQRTALASTETAGCPTAPKSFWYATVTVDQPSFAYAIGLANGKLPIFPGAVALTYTGN